MWLFEWNKGQGVNPRHLQRTCQSVPERDLILTGYILNCCRGSFFSFLFLPGETGISGKNGDFSGDTYVGVQQGEKELRERGRRREGLQENEKEKKSKWKSTKVEARQESEKSRKSLRSKEHREGRRGRGNRCDSSTAWLFVWLWVPAAEQRIMGL